MRYLLIAATLLSLSAAPFAAQAADTSTAPAAKTDAADADHFIPKEQWDKMTPEQKRAVHEKRMAEREAWHKKFEAASPAEREKMKAERKAKFEARKAEWQKRYDAASPEEKKKMDEERKRREEHHEEWLKEHGKGPQAPTGSTAK